MFFFFSVGSNNFFNYWLSLESHNKQLERPEEIKYKRALLIYLLVQGNLIFFFNNLKFSGVPCSVLVLVAHLIFMVSLIIINPYRQSLRVHQICVLFNQVVYLVFIIVINLINLVEDLNSLIILILAYFITFCCGVIMLLTIVRLYYEIR